MNQICKRRGLICERGVFGDERFGVVSRQSLVIGHLPLETEPEGFKHE